MRSKTAGIGNCDMTIYVLASVNQTLLCGHVLPLCLKVCRSSLHLHSSTMLRVLRYLQFELNHVIKTYFIKK